MRCFSILFCLQHVLRYTLVIAKVDPKKKPQSSWQGVKDRMLSSEPKNVYEEGGTVCGMAIVKLCMKGDVGWECFNAEDLLHALGYDRRRMKDAIDRYRKEAVEAGAEAAEHSAEEMKAVATNSGDAGANEPDVWAELTRLREELYGINPDTESLEKRLAEVEKRLPNTDTDASGDSAAQSLLPPGGGAAQSSNDICRALKHGLQANSEVEEGGVETWVKLTQQNSESIACPQGVVSSSGQLKCQSCSPDQYETGTRTHYNECKGGRFSNRGASSTRAYCSAGSDQSACSQCPQGKIAIEGETNCIPRDEGFHPKAFSETATSSPTPTRSPSFSRQSECNDYPSGKTSEETRSISYKDRPAGNYAEADSSNCDECFKGQTTSQRSRTCSACSEGFYSTYQRTSCSPCSECVSSHSNGVGYLLDELLQQQDNAGRNAYHIAATGGYKFICDWITKHCSKESSSELVKQQDSFGETVFHKAALGGHVNVCHSIANHFDEVVLRRILKVKNAVGETAYGIAQRRMFEDIRHWIQEKEKYSQELTHLSEDDITGDMLIAGQWSPLPRLPESMHGAIEAIRKRDIFLLQEVFNDASVLKQLNSPVTMRGRRTLLHLAAESDLVAGADWLLKQQKQGSKVNAVDQEGRTPLHVAAYFGHYGLIKLFLDACASVDIRSEFVETPLDAARQGKDAWGNSENLLQAAMNIYGYDGQNRCCYW